MTSLILGKGGGSGHQEASKSIKDLRIAEVVELDLQIENGKVMNYRTKLSISFKYQGKE